MLGGLKFKHRIAELVGLAAVALLAVTLVSIFLGRSAEREMSGVETRYLPLLELDRELKALYASIPRTLEAAVATGEESQLAEADRLRDQFALRLAAGKATIAANGGDADALVAEFRSYYHQAREVSAGLLAADSPEPFAARVAAMRDAEQKLAAHLDQATTPDRKRVAAAFANARREQHSAILIDIGVGLAALAMMLLLSWGIVRRTVVALHDVSLGMDRLARGEFGEEVKVSTRDEFGELARRANETAVVLREYREVGEREDWVKGALNRLAAECSGDLDPMALGARAVAFLARESGAALGIAYASDEAGGFRLIGSYGTGDAAAVPRAFHANEALVGRAVADDEICQIDDLPPGYVTVRSALGQAPPRHLLLVPFGHEERTMGVLELGLLRQPEERALELLRRARPVLGVVFRMSESRARAQLLLEETQRQAEELKDAYDTVERRNQTLQESEERLQAQQEELRQTNEELEEQTAALESQRLAVQKKNEELVAAQLELEEKAAELARASRYKSEFLANMSHELRTPLNSIMILSKILGEDGPEADARAHAERLEFARVIHKSGEELLALINDVLDLAKVEAGKQELHLDAVEVADMVAYVRRMFAPMARDKGLALEVVTEGDIPARVHTDHARVEQILKNLVSNAVKFTASGRVTVRLYVPRPDERPVVDRVRREDTLAISVRDTGIGIPPEKQTWIFEAFAQADGGTSRKYGGTGLGLTIARQLAQRLGGDLQVESTVGEGSTFYLWLPVAGPPPEAEASESRGHAAAASPGARAHVQGENGANGHGSAAFARRPRPSQPPLTLADDRHNLVPGDPCLLVVEDDPSFAEIVLRLVREAGFKGLVAATGQGGLELARRHKPSGIVLDVGLPDLDGWSVMERLKQDRATREIPVHFITAGDDRSRAEQLGAVGFLAKPVDLGQVRQALQALQASAGASLHKVLVIESDAAMREQLRDQLVGSVGEAGVEAVGTAAEALAKLQDGSVGCVVLDLSLPEKQDGFDLLARIRGDDRSAGVPVIVHTRLTLTPDEVLRLEVTEQALVILQGERSLERVLEETRLFLHRVRTGLPELRQRMTQVVHGSELPLAGKTVLIVDDDMRNVYSLSSALRAKELRVLTASDGQEALEELAQHPETSVVLMDVMMPRMDGHEATRRIRSEEKWKKLPIIALTAKTMPGERKKCLDAGANDYVPKPVDMDRLLSLLRVWLS